MRGVEIQLGILLVIYNRACEDSPSCESLRATHQAQVVIVDNSTEENTNAAYAAKNGFGYIAMGGNVGLAKAYNRGVRYLKEHTSATHVLLLDDDTTPPEEFFSLMRQAVENEPTATVFLPRVRDEKGWLSPCRIEGLRVTRIHDPAELTAQTVTGINSGLVIDLKVFEDYAYDEGYFLDYVDHAFLRDMKKRGAHICVTKAVLNQRFAANARGARKAKKIRFRIFKKDFRRFCGTSFQGRMTAWAVIMRRRIKLWLSR